MTELEKLQNSIVSFLGNKELSKLLWIILARLKKKDSGASINIQKNYLQITTDSINEIRMEKKHMALISLLKTE